MKNENIKNVFQKQIAKDRVNNLSTIAICTFKGYTLYSKNHLNPSSN